MGDGWWEARNTKGETGLIPEAYMEVLSLFSYMLIIICTFYVNNELANVAQN